NILITENGQPMLSDFGVAKLLDVEETMELTGTGVGIGTPEYMAPEQATNKLVDARADIYALGVVLFEMVTGHKPYTADTPMAVLIMHSRDPLPRPKSFAPNLPQGVENVLLKALAKNPDDRYETAGEFAKALDEAASGVARGRTPLPKLTGKMRRPWWIAAALTVAAIVVGVIGFALKGSLPLSGVTSVPTETLDVETSTPVKATNSPDNFIYDDFDSGTSINWKLWNSGCNNAAQINGVLTFDPEQAVGSCSVIPIKFWNSTIQELGTFEAQLRIANDFLGTGQAWASILFRSYDAPGSDWWAECGLVASPNRVQAAYNVQNSGQHKTDYGGSLPAAFDTWYTVRLETDPETMAFSCYVDDKLIKTVIPSDAEALRNAHFQYEIQSWRGTEAGDDPLAAQATTYVDNVRIFPGGTDLSAIRDQPTPLPSDPTLYDDFSNPAYDGKFDQSRWVVNLADEAAQQNGILVLRQKGKENQALRAEMARYANRNLSKPMFFQADFSLAEAAHAGVVSIMVEASRPEDRPYMQEVHCGLNATSGASLANMNCFDRWNMGPETFDDQYDVPSRYVDFDSWHTVRIEIDPATMTFTYYLDGERAGAHTPTRAETLKNFADFTFLIEVHTSTSEEFIGYVDNVRLGTFVP
ncbi:MAG: protein kinase, partial [Anaerolineales bacterium]|nr:protein kinase [Anaerolineales bacterium]